MSIDLSAAVLNFAVDHTIRGQSAGAYVDGEWTPGAETSRTVKALVYPMSGLELMRLPENERQQGLVTIFAPVPLQTASQSAATPAEVLEFNGSDYEIDRIEAWTSHGNYWQGRAALKGRG